MKRNPISDKQKAFLMTEHKRINLLSGSVRSGKTYISLIAWAIFVGSMPIDCEFIMIGKTLTTLKRNCLNLLLKLIGEKNFKFSSAQKTAVLFNRRVWLEGANDERSESKIRGMTLAGAYCDELTQIPKGFYMMLLSRLSLPGSRLYATTNPDSPTHWVKTNIIDDEKIQNQFAHWKFKIEDNDHNDPQYVEDLKASYSGVFYDRFIEGLWTRAEGLIYPNASKAITETVARNYESYQISCDYGIHNPTCFGLFGLSEGVWYMVKEYYHSGRETREPKTDDEYFQELTRFIGGLSIKKIIIDPSASSFITLIRRKTKYTVLHADNSVIEGIRNTTTVLNNGTLKINNCCIHTVNEFSSYSWDDKVTDEDKPVKESDHLMDCIRYFVQTNKLAVPKRKHLIY